MVTTELRKKAPLFPPGDYGYKISPEEKVKEVIRKYLRQHSPEELQKIVNDMVTENVIEQ